MNKMQSMKKQSAKPVLKIRANASLDEALNDLKAAWMRAERGEVFNETVLSFESWEPMARILTPKRMELIHAVRETKPKSIADLARGLKRDYKRVHADVGALVKSGVLQITSKGVEAPYAAIETKMLF